MIESYQMKNNVAPQSACVDTSVKVASYDTSEAKPARTPRNSIGTLALFGILLAFTCLVPFLNKAYTIDDPVFLLEARQILKTPLQPMSFGLCWVANTTCLVRAGSVGANARQGLMGYLLVPVILSGGAEAIAHLLQILLVCLAIFEMVRLSLRLDLDRVQAPFLFRSGYFGCLTNSTSGNR
jgi:hypothetical protein